MAWMGECEVRRREFDNEWKRERLKKAIMRDPFGGRLEHLQEIIMNRLGDDVEGNAKKVVPEMEDAKIALTKLFEECGGDEAKISEGFKALTHHYYNKDY
jgi:hypothetical protein